MFEQADRDRRPQETQLHPGPGTAIRATLCFDSLHSQCALMITLSLMEYLFIFQAGSVYCRVEEALNALMSYAFHVLFKDNYD